MSVEILTVSLSDESVEKLAYRTAVLLHERMGGNQSTTHSNPPSQNSHSTQSGPNYDDDPWAGTNATPPPSQGQQQQQSNAPRCAHGEMRYVPAGFSQSTGRSYDAFWGCSGPRNLPRDQKCKSVSPRE